MATQHLHRSLFTNARRNLLSSFSRSYTTASSAVIPNSSYFLFRLRPLIAAGSACYFRRLAPALSIRGFATRHTSSSLNDPNPNWSNRPPKETILLDGCDFEHWLVVMEKPEGEPTRDEIIDSYIKTLAMVVGSEDEARMKIYSVSTRHYFAFGALVSEELSYKIKELPKVRWVLPDSYLDVRNKDYGGEPFINGQAVPYDPKYHEEWVRNNARANERNRRNDRPRNFDRSRNFERRRDMQMGNQNMGVNLGGQGGRAPTNIAAMPQNVPNAGVAQPNTNQQPSNMGGQPNYGSGVPLNNPPNYAANNTGVPNNAPNYQYGHGPNSGGAPYQSGLGPNQNFTPNIGADPGPSPNSYAPNIRPGPGQSPNMGPGPGQSPNMGPGPGQNPNMGPGHWQNPNIGPGQWQNSNIGSASSQYQNSQPNVRPVQGQNQSSYGQNMDSRSPHPNQNAPGRDFPPTDY